jgi:hypothetical protein
VTLIRDRREAVRKLRLFEGKAPKDKLKLALPDAGSGEGTPS